MNDRAAPTNQTTVKLLRALSSGIRSRLFLFAILIPPADFYRDRRVFESLYLDFGEKAHQHWAASLIFAAVNLSRWEILVVSLRRYLRSRDAGGAASATVVRELSLKVAGNTLHSAPQPSLTPWCPINRERRLKNALRIDCVCQMADQVIQSQIPTTESGGDSANQCLGR